MLARLIEQVEARAAGAADVPAYRRHTLLRLPGGEALDPRLIGLGTFPAAVALAIELGRRAGLDVDHPAWVDAYYKAARLTD